MMNNVKGNNQSQRPIGIFDSGIGGLTVTKAIVEQLPNEEIIYFGDTAHLPYGEKSVTAIQGYSTKIVDLLLERGCKLILIACNSASAAAYDLIKKHVNNRALVINVIDPVVELVNANYANKIVGLIGTKLTVNSRVYQKKIELLNKNITVRSLATPLLVPAIEEGFFQHQIIDVILSAYLSQPILQDIDALILGCTHYPVIKNSIIEFYNGKIDIIDASSVVAALVKRQLGMYGLLNQSQQIPVQRQFYVSDYTEAFATSTRLFFSDDIKLDYYPFECN